MVRLLTLDGVPRTPGKEPMEPKPHPAKEAIEKAKEALDKTKAAERAARLRERVRERAEPPEPREARSVARPGSLTIADLFTGRAPMLPEIDVMGALKYLANHGNQHNENMGVVRDMANRTGFVTEKQFNFAKAICLKPRNAVMLGVHYDLRGLRAQRFIPPSVRPASDNHPLDGKTARFKALLNSLTPGNHVTVEYTLTTADGKGKTSVRSFVIPETMFRFEGVDEVGVGETVNVAIDARWMLTARGIDPRRIPGCRLS